MKAKLILPAGEIPDMSTVCKRGGSTNYTLREKITVHSPNGKPQILESTDCVYLVGDTGSINAVSKGTELVWFADTDEIRGHLDALDGNVPK